jgi:uncharacterized repeat protein (TIGR04076 family)
MDLIVHIKEIRGYCPVYKKGDSFKLVQGYQLVADIPLCMHSLASLMPYYNAIRVSDISGWGLTGKKDGDKMYFQCLDPYCYTGGGTVIFEVTREGE